MSKALLNARNKMAVYTYEICDEAGQVRKGTLEAETSEVAASRLKSSGDHIISLREGKKPLKEGKKPLKEDEQPLVSPLSQPIRLPWLKTVKSRDLVIFNRQLATMISSGLPLIDNLRVLSEQTESRELGETLKKVEADISSGSSFSKALAKFPKVFSHLYVSMVQAGETGGVGGVLDEVLNRLALFLEKEEKIKRDIKAATLYPKLLIGVVIGGVVFMFMFVLPQFLTMFTEMGSALPLSTRILIALMSFTSGYKYLIASIALISILAFLGYKKSEKGKFYYDLLQMKLPVIGRLVRKIVISRCCRTLGLLYGCGVPLLETLETVEGVAGNEVVARALSEVRRNVEEGTGIAKPLKETGVFPPMAVYMIKVGEETGKLGLMLEKIADFYDEEIESSVKGLSSALEPLLLGVMALAVGFIVVSIYFPMFDMINTIKIK